jgi:hypothetical protein
MLSSIKSTVRIDPVRSAMAKADRLADDGDWERAIGELERMLEQYETRDDLRAKVQELRQRQGEAAQRDGGGRWWVWVAGLAILLAVAVWAF